MSKAISVVIGVLVIAVLSTSIRYKFINSGNCGVVVNSSGTNKGVEPVPRGVGRVWYCPWFTEVIEFTTVEQNIVWAKVGTNGDESFTISSKESASISVDVGLTFYLKEEKVPHLFSVLRKDIDYISHHWMRNHVREALSKAAEEVDTISLLGEGKSEVLKKAKDSLNEELVEYGIVVKMLSFVNTPRPEERILQAINVTIQSQQVAKQAENKVAEAKAIANQKIESAKGEAEGIKLKAIAQLEASTNEAKANELLSKSLTPELIKLKMVEKWDGTLPKFTGDSVPLIDLKDVK